MLPSGHCFTLERDVFIHSDVFVGKHVCQYNHRVHRDSSTLMLISFTVQENVQITFLEHRIWAGLGLHMKVKTLFMSDEENTTVILIYVPLFFNMSKQFLAAKGLSAEYVQVIVMSRPQGAAAYCNKTNDHFSANLPLPWLQYFTLFSRV